jgi:general secretion pathway protein B
MSYILDALKKSDQERRQGEIPTLESDHAVLIAVRNQRSARKRKMLFLLFSACLLVLAAGLWQWRSQTDIPRIIKKTAAQEQTAVVAESALQSPSQPAGQNVPDQLDVPAEKPASQAAVPAQESAPPPPAPAQRVPETVPVTIAEPTVVPPATENQAAPRPQAEQPPPPPPAKATSQPDKNPPLLKDLPVAQQKNIPNISMAGHVYSDEPARRMIMINNKIVREGERIGDNLKLVRITWDGVILSHDNTEFQIKL